MSKGVVGIGDSFTWGEGLYFYSGLDELPLKPTHEFSEEEVKLSHRLYKNKNGYVNLVAEYYNTWSLLGEGNGGDNVFSFKQRLNRMFGKNALSKSDVSLFIFQFTQIFRNSNYSLQEQIQYVDHHLLELEKHGIKCVSICWTYDITRKDSIYWDLFKDRHVQLKFNNEIYDNFEEMSRVPNSNIRILSDFNPLNYQKNDLHLNLKGQRILADSIIQKLEHDNFWIPSNFDINEEYINKHRMNPKNEI